MTLAPTDLPWIVILTPIVTGGVAVLAWWAITQILERRWLRRLDEQSRRIDEAYQSWARWENEFEAAEPD